MTTLRPWFAPTFVLAALFEFLQIGEDAACFSVDPRKVDGFRLLNEEFQRGLTTGESLFGAEVRHLLLRFFGRNCKLGNANIFWPDPWRR